MTVFLLFTGNTRFDSRSLKFITILERLDTTPIIIELSPSDRQLPFLKQVLIIGTQWLKACLKRRPDLVLCVDIFSAPFGILSSLLFNSKLLFDAREFNRDVEAYRTQPFKKTVWGMVERLAFQSADLTTTVSESAKQYFKAQYGKNPLVIHNINASNPSVQSEHLIRKQFSIPLNGFIWVFLGNIQQGRGFELAMEFIQKRPENEFLVCIGRVKMDPQPSLSDRTFLLGEVNPAQIIPTLEQANAGLIFIQGDALSYRLSLPNKFFDFVLAELPVLSLPLPEMMTRISDYKLGFWGEVNELQNLANQLVTEYHFFKKGTIFYKNKIAKTNDLDPIVESLRLMLP